MKNLKVVLARPRGFCAGVDRAIQIVEKAIAKYGVPVYVRHEIVHNKFVVEDLKSKGAIFVNEVDDAPIDRPIIFSAHGVSKGVVNQAKSANMLYIDATCPLVSKVHRVVEYHHNNGDLVILIGHKNHPEVIGTMGQVPDGSVILVENIEDVENLSLPKDVGVAYATQTTLSVDDTKDIIDALKNKFPFIKSPRNDDICYATTNRQMAVQAMAKVVDGIVVIGATNSSNSVRLVEVSKKQGCKNAFLWQDHNDIDWIWLEKINSLGITAGASAPEILVESILKELGKKFSLKIEELNIVEENVIFRVPKILE
jgi:4-hydroxy-3-methylbut-2-enyl diphosphate reductase